MKSGKEGLYILEILWKLGEGSISNGENLHCLGLLIALPSRFTRHDGMVVLWQASNTQKDQRHSPYRKLPSILSFSKAAKLVM